MKKFDLFILLAIMLLAVGCESEVNDQKTERPVIKDGQASITIMGDSMITTRSTNGRVEFAGGYATGAGLYDGDGEAVVEAVPYSGYQLVSFTGGKVGGNLSQYAGSSQYKFRIEHSDWKFSVSFKKKIDLRFIAVGENGHILYYDKGDATVRQLDDITWRSLTYGRGKYVAVGINGSYGQVTYSSDGLNWNTSDISDVLELYGVTYGSDKFVTVGHSKLAYSYDGMNWTSTNIGKYNYNGLNGVAYGNGKFVAVGVGGYSNRTFVYSSDGINWAEVDIPSSMYAVAYGNGKFVAVGNGYSFYSSDGVNWTSSNLTGAYSGITYGNGKYVAVGTNGKVACSSDGKNWSTNVLMSGYKSWSFYSVTYATNRFIAIGSKGNVAYSSDGLDWETMSTGVDILFRGICPIN